MDNGAMLTSIMVDVQLDLDDKVPLYEQVAAELRKAIANGEVGPGERLPPARDLAAVLKVNHNTVLRALRDLRDEGVLEFRRGRGVTVAADAPRRSVIDGKVRELLRTARQLGYGKRELIELIARS
jgi:DNA-binding transcriptional regulator YhcF (GntR family)